MRQHRSVLCLLLFLVSTVSAARRKGRSSNWQDLMKTMVDTFKKHKQFVWSVAEEYGEGLSKAQVSQ